MNNPLRYAGETFYQSGYYRDPDTGEETTTLQVVTNTGWMIPYVSCMIVWIGLQSHFVNILLRFIYRELATAVGRGVAKRIAEDKEAAESEPGPQKRRIQQKDINRPALVYESIVPDRRKQMQISIICSVVAVFVLDGWLLSKANLARVEKRSYQTLRIWQDSGCLSRDVQNRSTHWLAIACGSSRIGSRSIGRWTRKPFERTETKFRRHLEKSGRMIHSTPSMTSRERLTNS